MPETWGNGHYNCCGCAELEKRSKRCLGCLTATPLGKVYMENWTPKEKPKQTKADVIRAMSDEELAEFLERVEAEGYRDSSITPKMENGYHMGMLQWLKSEAKE